MSQIKNAAFAVLSGILRDKTMEDKLMYIPNNDIQNYPFVIERGLKNFRYQCNLQSNVLSLPEYNQL